MKANELRIGNYVIVNPIDKPQIIVDVLCDGINTHDIECSHYGLVSAIPLTEEWLLKFGFVKRIVNNFEVWGVSYSNYFIDIRFNQLIGFYFMINAYQHGFPLSFVHQLQNLYFALTNEELSIS